MASMLGRRRTLMTATACAFGLGFGIGALAGFAPAEPGQAARLANAPAAELLPGPLMAAAPAPSAPAPLLPSPAGAVPLPEAAAPAVPPPAEDAPVPMLVERPLLAPQATAAPAALAENSAERAALVIERGDTLMDLLQRAAIEPNEAHAAIEALGKLYDPRRLRTGQNLVLALADAPEGERRQLLSLALDLTFDHQLLVTRGADGSFASRKIERPQQRATVHRAGPIEDSLYLSAQRAAMPPDVLEQMIKLFSWDVDFQRDIRAGDRFETLYDSVSLESDASAVRGELLFAQLELSARQLEAYRFTASDGSTGYYDRGGRSLRKFLLRTPVDGARLSSTFGMRKHPILGYSRMHKGVDFAAPSGTPIYAAGSGRVETAGPNGGFGNYIRIRHSDEYGTAYAHMARFAKGIRAGKRVRQGQVIGYVGTTGRSTGPHLHYEVLRHGEQINPLKIKQASATQLAGAELERFKAVVARIDDQRRSLDGAPAVASTAN
jgi:murein DD-endopeptidase MepM/ murein hydrolase activator NlpD